MRQSFSQIACFQVYPPLGPTFCRFGALEEVVKFPEATYAFVSYLHASAAAAAVQALHGMTVRLCER